MPRDILWWIFIAFIIIFLTFMVGDTLKRIDNLEEDYHHLRNRVAELEIKNQ